MNAFVTRDTRTEATAADTADQHIIIIISSSSSTRITTCGLATSLHPPPAPTLLQSTAQVRAVWSSLTDTT